MMHKGDGRQLLVTPTKPSIAFVNRPGTNSRVNKKF